jgi:uncharacterized protein YecE (DUF72 family)
MIKIGTSGFQFSDWKGAVYPENIKSPDMLGYYEDVLGFDAVELNFTYYTLPYPGTMLKMSEKTSGGFVFVVRSHKEMTHDIWTDDKRSELKDTGDVFKRFIDGIEPLIRQKKLGCVLLQFPYYFTPLAQNYEYIERCLGLMKGIDTVVEFRHRAWIKDKTFDFLSKNGAGFCIVDEPGLAGLVPAVFRNTGDIGYFRLHGRNKKWFKADKQERYNYNYSIEELKEFVPEIKKIDKVTDYFYIFFNNCTGGRAAENASSLKDLLKL